MASTTEPTPTPTVVVDDVHVKYRVYASGKRIGAGDDPVGRAGRRGMREIHALKGVSFVAHEGETIGVVGHNGSGKSTLMRAMSGLMPTWSGRIWAQDRPILLGVNAALLPELSGESNIKLGLLALGFTPQEAEQLAPSVAEFADLQAFISYPMRTYSAGMSARLRFAIAAAKNHSVLLIDEALSVGDKAFKLKSQQRIRELQESAGTVFLVSHSMRTIREMCSRVLWIDRGVLRMDGAPDEVTAAYEATSGSTPRAERATVDLARSLDGGPPLPVFERTRVELDAPAEASAFSVLKTDDDVRLYFRDGASPARVVWAGSRDGISFGETTTLVTDTHLADNFTAFRDGRWIRGIGGRIVPGSTRPGADGLYRVLIEYDRIARKPTRMVAAEHPGLVSGIDAAGKADEIDRQACALYAPKLREHFLYLTSRPTESERGIQVARAAKWGEFGAFEPVVLEGVEPGEIVYGPAFTRAGQDFVGLIAVYTDEVSSVRVVRSRDGVTWKASHELLSAPTWRDAEGVAWPADIPVQGAVVRGKNVHFYVQRNFGGLGAQEAPYLERFTLARADFAAD